jgi:D-3-phosphoglycerate dehydrogenase / 2-oxoglutarate reductase
MAQTKNLLVTAWPAEDSHPSLVKAREAGFVVANHRRPAFRTEAEMIALIESLGGVDGVIAGSDVYNAAVMDAVKPGRLKVVSRVGVGFDSVDVPAATARGIAVCTTPGTNQDSVADHAFGMILSLARMIPIQNNYVKGGQWKRLTAADVHRATLGILGLGKIGKGMAKRGRGFDMRVIAYDPYWDEGFAAANGVEKASLEEVIAQADFLTLHLPASAETKRIMNAERLALMKPTAYLINTARGTLVDEPALLAALKAGQIAGAGLDVFDVEPCYGTVGEELLKLDNVVATGHVGGFSKHANFAMVEMAVENALLAIEGKKPLFRVNPEG